MENKAITHLANLLQCCIDKKAHLSGKILHAYILRNILDSNTFLCNRLVEFYSKCGRTISARQVFDKILHKNIYSWHTMLDCYCKNRNLEEANNLFEEMPERNAVSWNTLISALVRSWSEENALRMYRRMRSEGFVPTHCTLASVLSACGALADADFGSRCHGVAVRIGLERNLYVANALLSMYAKSGCTREAIRAFWDLVEPNEVSFTAMMGVLAENERVEEAFSMFGSMRRLGIRVDAVSLSSVFAVCANVQSNGFSNNIYGRQVHGLTIKLGFEKDLHLSNSLLDTYAKNGDMESAEMIFTNIPQVSVVSWNIMIGGYGQKGQILKALDYMQRMQFEGIEPDEVTNVNMLSACMKCGDFEIGRRIFEKMSFPSVSSWNAIISGYSQIENHKEAIELFREMQFESVQTDRITFCIILSSCASIGFLEAGKQIHAASYRCMIDSDVYIASGLIGMYSKCNNVAMANCVFDIIPERDIVCWNSLMAGLSVNSQDKKAFNLFKKMLEEGMFPTQFSYTTALSCCAKLSSLSQGRQIHAQTLNNGCVSDIFVGSSLIDMYCKCGNVELARQFFDSTLFKNTVTWNEIIHGYAQNGSGNEALALYETMIESGEEPDNITFIAILTACSHSGLVQTGVRIFNSMEQDHGVVPRIDHYTCIIDALGRAGRFDEVVVILDKMPYKDDSIVWEVVLSSCRVHCNVSLARRAAEELFRLDPGNSTPYVLLANIYSSLGRWEEVKAIRGMMNDNNVIKNIPGCSWVEHPNLLRPDKKSPKS